MIPLEEVNRFKPKIIGRPRKNTPMWRTSPDDNMLLTISIFVNIRADQQERFKQTLDAIKQSGEHLFPGTDPLPPGQVWAISPGGPDENAGLYRIDVNTGPGAGVKIINVPVPGPFRESIKYGEQNLLTRARDLVGDRDPRHHEFIVQLRAFDTAKTGSHLGLPALLAFCSALLAKSLKGGLIIVGGLNLGGGLDPVYNAVNVAELAIEKGASTLLIPISARRQ